MQLIPRFKEGTPKRSFTLPIAYTTPSESTQTLLGNRIRMLVLREEEAQKAVLNTSRPNTIRGRAKAAANRRLAVGGTKVNYPKELKEQDALDIKDYQEHAAREYWVDTDGKYMDTHKKGVYGYLADAFHGLGEGFRGGAAMLAPELSPVLYAPELWQASENGTSAIRQFSNGNLKAGAGYTLASVLGLATAIPAVPKSARMADPIFLQKEAQRLIENNAVRHLDPAIELNLRRIAGGEALAMPLILPGGFTTKNGLWIPRYYGEHPSAISVARMNADNGIALTGKMTPKGEISPVYMFGTRGSHDLLFDPRFNNLYGGNWAGIDNPMTTAYYSAGTIANDKLAAEFVAALPTESRRYALDLINEYRGILGSRTGGSQFSRGMFAMPSQQLQNRLLEILRDLAAISNNSGALNTTQLRSMAPVDSRSLVFIEGNGKNYTDKLGTSLVKDVKENNAPRLAVVGEKGQPTSLVGADKRAQLRSQSINHSAKQLGTADNAAYAYSREGYVPIFQNVSNPYPGNTILFPNWFATNKQGGKLIPRNP